MVINLSWWLILEGGGGAGTCWDCRLSIVRNDGDVGGDDDSFESDLCRISWFSSLSIFNVLECLSNARENKRRLKGKNKAIGFERT